MKPIVDDEMKERIKALLTKGYTNDQISEKLGLKLSTTAYHTTKLRKNGNGKKPVKVDTLAYQEKSLSETFFGETITGFFVYEEQLYCVMESGIALRVQQAESLSKERVNEIKKKMKYELEQIQRRVKLFDDWGKTE